MNDLTKHVPGSLVIVSEDDILLAMLKVKSADSIGGYEVVRVDPSVIEDLNFVQKCIIGSDLGVKDLNRSLMYVDQTSALGLQIEQWLKRTLQKPLVYSCVKEVRANVVKFLEVFEICAHKRMEQDSFQCGFEMWIAYTALVKLEYIRRDGRHFLYLPKMVFAAFPDDVRLVINQLEPTGDADMVGRLLEAYLNQFVMTYSVLLREPAIRTVVQDTEINVEDRFPELSTIVDIITPLIERVPPVEQQSADV
ncbi:hypothetical protein SARC_01120 [Sphaeroforma arctica JP610]|uniref:Uncharacterized protein n=1 Tax=Sphaeroforma arctica JP610 TaxID=667725 RepID=A0A0L0GCX4_9EUKA|nr:hypothetical protein SARC_01120 [Sphaeroforma arctica JP610]KNC86741.1 hypothetical protein SARC_01120 [Sphaeroforma arctica JP610]|eukprot:XP_014160643.1 hypothetical protein SARC_01120 [Sphaeroforma arctica JP610]